MSAEPTYETNVARVEEIIRRLDAGESGLSETLLLVREGKELIERCAGELEAVGGALEELRLEDLVARLESESSAGEGAKGGGARGEETQGEGMKGSGARGEGARGGGAQSEGTQDAYRTAEGSQ